MNLAETGIVTVDEWQLMPDGNEYVHIFCNKWQLHIERDLPIEMFRSMKNVTLLGIDDNNIIKLIIPGDRIRGFVYCDKCPESKRYIGAIRKVNKCYDFSL